MIVINLRTRSGALQNTIIFNPDDPQGKAHENKVLVGDIWYKDMRRGLDKSYIHQIQSVNSSGTIAITKRSEIMNGQASPLGEYQRNIKINFLNDTSCTFLIYRSGKVK